MERAKLTEDTPVAGIYPTVLKKNTEVGIMEWGEKESLCLSILAGAVVISTDKLERLEEKQDEQED